MSEAAPVDPPVDEADQQTFPGFEGRPVRGASISLSGTVRVDDSIPTIGNDDEVRIVITGKVKAINHARRPKTGIVREQTVEVTSVETVKVTKKGDGTVEFRHRNDDENADGSETRSH